MKTAGAFKPFRHLKQMMRQKAIPIESLPAERFPATVPEAFEGDRDDILFAMAMADVTPLEQTTAPPDNAPQAPRRPRLSEADRTLNALRDLIRTGRGYRVADTPEYIEGTGHQVPPGITRELHKGTFSIQASIDLHGMTAQAAREAVDAFLTDAVQRSHVAVLIVHGRGLSSAAEPVLKSKIPRWLTTGKWRKWVMAYSSARPCDGGAGATYVLLRPRPLAKSRRRPHRV
ncbi:MAG: Smr/MutS family protein [Desulfobacterales bacterium]|nr:Smr/MutS family protein [Desulfobacterales bacterium]MDJ0989294.1 Smr/MutS family protein [Desulfobacterales bacterium]